MATRGGAAVYGTEAEVFAVEDGLVKQLGHVVAVEGVDDAAAAALTFHEPEVAEQPELVGNRGLLHSSGC